MEELEKLIEDLARRALEEDAASKDRTTALVVDRSCAGSASIVAKAAGTVSGHEAAAAVFRLVDADTEYAPVVNDGSRVGPGETVSRVRGRLSSIITAERTALNFLQHLSGVATMTARFVERVKGSGAVILDTRKTIPGLRRLEKRAVVHGGGSNHRQDLGGMVLVKDNHIAAAGGLGAVLHSLAAAAEKAAEIEVSSIEQLRMLRSSPPGRVMLDNFSPAMLEAALGELAQWGATVPEIEVSGGITLESVHRFARPGVGYISVGLLTSSAPALDMSLAVEEVIRRGLEPEG